jgi:Ni/Fe-hydrogenase 1 B-type cytochrome subunit
MVAAYVFTVSCLIRLYWAFVGNEHGRVRVFFPFTRKRWREVIEYMKFYLFMRKTLPYAPGHTASAALAYLGLFLLYLVEIVSGFSLYSQSHHGFLWTVMGGWLLSYISGPTLRLIHHFVMWLIFAFVILHLYIAWVNEIVGKDFVISSIFGGYKTPHEE